MAIFHGDSWLSNGFGHGKRHVGGMMESMKNPSCFTKVRGRDWTWFVDLAPEDSWDMGDTQKRQGCRSDIAIYRVFTWQRQSSHVVDHGVPWFSQLPPFLFRSSPATLPRWHRNEPVGGFGSNTWDRSKLTVSAFVPSVCSPEKWCCVKNPNFCHILIRGFPWMVYKDL